MQRSKEYLADLIWIRHDRRPVDVWMQGLLVVARFADHTTAVHRLEQLEEASGALTVCKRSDETCTTHGRLLPFGLDRCAEAVLEQLEAGPR